MRALVVRETILKYTKNSIRRGIPHFCRDFCFSFLNHKQAESQRNDCLKEY